MNEQQLFIENEKYLRRRKRKNIFSFLLGVALLVTIALLISTSGNKNKPADLRAFATDDLTLFVSKYGAADKIISSEHEIPKPAIVTKQLFYTKENVNAVYYLDKGSWQLLGFQDVRTNKVLTPTEVVERLSKRVQP